RVGVVGLCCVAIHFRPPSSLCPLISSALMISQSSPLTQPKRVPVHRWIGLEVHDFTTSGLGPFIGPIHRGKVKVHKHHMPTRPDEPPTSFETTFIVTGFHRGRSDCSHHVETLGRQLIG